MTAMAGNACPWIVVVWQFESEPWKLFGKVLDSGPGCAKDFSPKLIPNPEPTAFRRWCFSSLIACSLI